jgi:hypothetical protein
MLLERASANGPLVVIMEDIDWADESTRHLRRFLARALTDGPVMIITSGGGRTLRAPPIGFGAACAGFRGYYPSWSRRRVR